MASLHDLGSRSKLEKLFDHRDFTAVAQEIHEHADLFASKYEQDFRQNFKQSPFKDSPCMICRMSYDPIEMAGDTPTEEELVHHLKTKGLTSIQAYDTELYSLLPKVYDVVMWLAAILKAEQIGRVMVARLLPGGHVKPHKDYGPYHDFYDRFHICIDGAGCYFRCDRETVKMLPGDVWWFHNNDEHEVHNDSGVPRDHVIVDFKLRGDKRVLRHGGELGQVFGPGERGDSGGALEGVGAQQRQGTAPAPVARIRGKGKKRPVANHGDVQKGGAGA